MTEHPDHDPAFDALRSLRADVPPLDDRTAGRIYAASLRRATPSPVTPVPGRITRRRLIRVAFVTAAVTALVAGTALVLRPAPVSADEVLTRAAAAAANAAGPAADSAYRYVEVLRINGPNTLRVQTWTSVDGTAPGRQTVTTTNGQSVATTIPAPTGESLATSSPKTLAALPTEPTALLDRLAADPDVRSDITNNGTAPDVAIWEEIRELAEIADGPTQSALFTAATHIDGLTVTENVVDAAGRTGTAVALTDPRLGEIQLIFTPDGAFLGERILSTSTDRPQFTSARLDSGYVTSL